MKSYELTYRQPYEFDDDSPQGDGDHDIGYSVDSGTFVADNDTMARQQVKEFLSNGSITFSHHIDGDGKTYKREFVKLTKDIGMGRLR